MAQCSRVVLMPVNAEKRLDQPNGDTTGHNKFLRQYLWQVLLKQQAGVHMNTEMGFACCNHSFCLCWPLRNFTVPPPQLGKNKKTLGKHREGIWC